MATRDKGRGTLILDRRFTGVGRVKRASGTNDAKTYKRLTAMLETLHAKGRLDLLMALRDGHLTPLELWDAYRRDDVDRLPSAETVRPLWTSADEDADTGLVAGWLGAWSQSAHHKRATASTFRQLRALAPVVQGVPTARVHDLPDLLAKYRTRCERAGFGVSFNRARSHVQAFLRAQLGRSHPLYRAVGDLDRLATQRAEGRPLTVAAFLALAARLTQVAPAHAAILRGMCTTGMGPGEFWGRWTIETPEGVASDRRVRIHGTKRDGRKRVVPLVTVFGALTAPDRHPRTFADILAKVSGGAVEPYDLRRTYATWLEAAGVPRTRRKLYLGHAAGDVTDLYERHEVEAYLRADGELLRTYLTGERDRAGQGGTTPDADTPTTSNTTGPREGPRVED